MSGRRERAWEVVRAGLGIRALLHARIDVELLMRPVGSESEAPRLAAREQREAGPGEDEFPVAAGKPTSSNRDGRIEPLRCPKYARGGAAMPITVPLRG